tara:strand:+ start:2612 stop:3301 length:690 start_codon:yes stop_codon:yes gene_type:complete
MHQLINKNKIYFYLTLLILLTSITNEHFSKIFKNYFIVNNIIVETPLPEIKSKIFLNTKYLLTKNIFFINKKELTNSIKKLNFLEKVHIKKRFPSTLVIKASVTNLIAETYIDQEKYFLGSNKEFIKSKHIENNKNLPIIFGNFEISDYFDIKSKIHKQNFNGVQILKYYFHKNKRWDLYFQNNIVIKLPNKNINSTLNAFEKFKKFNDIKPNTVIDLRIPNRIIIKSG